MNNYSLQSLSDSVWIFSALMALSELGALPLLETGCTLKKLAAETNSSEQFLTAALNLLIAAGLVSKDKSLFQVSGDLKTTLEKGGYSRMMRQMQNTFGQARELIVASQKHELKLGWQHTDDNILQAQGQFSEIVATDFVPASPELQTLLQKPGATFLDVGAGVGRITLKMCELYPHLQAVALEPADHPFHLAQKNIKASRHKNHIELRKIGLQDLPDVNAFDVIWIAQGYIVDEYFLPGLINIKRALKSNGMILIAAIPFQNDITSYAKCFASTLHGGGRTRDDIIFALENAGFSKITEIMANKSYSVITATSN